MIIAEDTCNRMKLYSGSFMCTCPKLGGNYIINMRLDSLIRSDYPPEKR